MRAMLPGGLRTADTLVASRAGVDRLFKLLSLRAGEADPERRLVTADVIADTVGGTVDLAPKDRWDAVKIEYLAQVAGMEPTGIVETAFALPHSEDGPHQLRAIDVVDSPDPFLIYGRTGTGKSSAAKELRFAGAQQGVPVVLVQAEAYLDGYLDGLIADELSAVVGRDLRSIVGRQALGDRRVRILIDGVSEVQEATRLALASETGPHISAGHGSRLTLLGRDPAICSSLLPSGVTALRLPVAPLDGARRESLACLLLYPDHPIVPPDAESSGIEKEIMQACQRAVAQAERALGDAAGNPMLLDMALRTIAEGISFKNRASLYQATIERMAHRGNTADIATTSAGLGLVFSELLNDGRRYARPVEWDRLLSNAADRLTTLGVPNDSAAIRNDLLRSGLATAVVAKVGNTQVRGAVHDSFADYLAGFVISEQLVDFPNPVSIEDEQRILFAAEMRPIPVDAVLAVARVSPFTLVALSQHDRMPLEQDGPQRVAELLRLVMPNLEDARVNCWRVGERIAVQLRHGGGQSRWIDSESAQEARATGPRVILQNEEGVSVAAVGLWRLALRARLQTESWLRPPTPKNIDEARTQVEAHAHAVARAFEELLPHVVPRHQLERVEATVGPLGLAAVVYPQVSVSWGGRYWPLTSSTSKTMFVTANAAPADNQVRAHGDTFAVETASSVDWYLRQSPAAAAADILITAFNELVRKKWL